MNLTPTPPRPRLLVVDDDAALRGALADLLAQAGFDVGTAGDGQAMRAALEAAPPALVLLDLRLQGEDGLTLARALRQSSAVPLIMMSGQCDETDRVLLLELAADDFLIKPFGHRELLARVRAVLRRTVPQADPREARAPRRLHRFGDWQLDPDARELLDLQGRTCALTQGEYRLLEALVKSPGRVWTREQLLEHTRSIDTDVFDRAVDVLILRLRRKIEPNPKHPRYIVTERGLGYMFCVPVDTAVAG